MYVCYPVMLDKTLDRFFYGFYGHLNLFFILKFNIYQIMSYLFEYQFINNKPFFFKIHFFPVDAGKWWIPVVLHTPNLVMIHL